MIKVILVVLLITSCSSTQHISKYDPSMASGLASARTALNAYIPDTLAGPHQRNAQFYADEHAEFQTLLAQARSTPLNDSATIVALVVADSALSRLQYIEFTLNDALLSHLRFFRNEVNANIDVAIAAEQIKLQEPK